MNKVEPRTLSGFMELLPEQQILFNQMKEVIENTYKMHGFLPLDTPVIELSEILLAKAGGETEKQIYRFNRGNNDLSLRFDLTVPLSKYVAKNYGNLSFPFRRYQIGKVYRGERTQKGRFREFYQCDIDIIGDEELDIINDAELPSVIYEIFKGLGFDKFTICINNRKILNGLFESIGEKDKATDILHVIDKIDKIGKNNVIKELSEIGLNQEKIEKVIEFIEIKGNTDEKLEKIENLNIENESFKKGFEELKQVIKYVRIFGIPDSNFKIDLTIARGLDYYTRTVFEFVSEDDGLTVLGGGRYDGLVKEVGGQDTPAVGFAMGAERLLEVFERYNKDVVKPKVMDLYVANIGEKANEFATELVLKLRDKGVFVEKDICERSLKAQFKYADKNNAKFVLTLGDDEVETKKAKIKNMQSGEEIEVELNADEIVKVIM